MTDTLVKRPEAASLSREVVSAPPRWRSGAARVAGPVRRLSGPLGKRRPGLKLPGQAVSLLALMALGLAGHLAFTSHLMQARSQDLAYAEFRTELAIGTAPVAQYDAEGALLAFGQPVAVLRIPRLGLQQVVGEGTTSGVLAEGPGHRRDTVLPGQAGASVVLGRRFAYGGPFRDIAALQLGDRIVSTTGQGRAVYRVTGIRRAGDPLPQPLEESQGRLTLVTGAGPWWAPDGVLRVDAILETEPQPAAPRIISTALLGPAEQVMAVDRSAVVPLLLWCQALLLAAAGFVWVRSRWGRRQAWVVGVPVLVVLGLTVADQITRLLPNLL